MKIEGEVRYNSGRTPQPNFAFENWVVIVQAIDTLNYVAVTTNVNGMYDVNDIPVGTYHVTTRKDFSGTTEPVSGSWNNVQIGGELFETIIPEITDLPNHFTVPSGATHVDFLSFATGVVAGEEYSATYVKTFVMSPLKREYFPVPSGRVPTGGNLIVDADNGRFIGAAEKGVINKDIQTNLYPNITNLSLNTGLGTSDPMVGGEYAITSTRTIGGTLNSETVWRTADRTGTEESSLMLAYLYPNAHIFRTTVTLEPNSEYMLTAWFAGVVKKESILWGISLKIAGAITQDFNLGTLPGSSEILEWKQLGVVFNSENGGEVTLTLEQIGSGSELVGFDEIRLEKTRGETTMCEFTEIDWGEGVVIDSVDTEVGLRESLLGASTNNQPTTIELSSNITLTSGNLEVLANSRVRLRSMGQGQYEINAQELSRVIRMSDNAILHLENISIVNGKETDEVGGGILHDGFSGNAELVLGAGVRIINCHAVDGGGVFGFGMSVWIDGADISNCTATGLEELEAICGGVGAACVLMTAGTIQNCEAKYIGGLGALNLEITGGMIRNNRAEAGAGVAVLGDGVIRGDAVIDHNVASGDGGGVYKNSEFAPIYPGGGGTLDISGTVWFDHNISGGNGGAIYLTHQDLPNLTVAEGVEFSFNEAASETLAIHPLDQPTYDANIKAIVWSDGRLFGYSNFDIAYQADSDTCGGTGEQMITMSQPVRVRPFTKIGTIVNRCCGPAWTTNGIDPQPPTPIEDCDFTLSQRICVEVPVEFGAEVEVMPASAECTGEDCSTCEQGPTPIATSGELGLMTLGAKTTCASGNCGAATSITTPEAKIDATINAEEEEN